MPQRLGTPGVYVEEIPSGRRVIRSVATSVGAFVDFFRKGPMNTPVRIFGTGDFDRVFGGYDTRSEASFAIPQFFLNGGAEAWVVRVALNSSSGPLKASFTNIANADADVSAEPILNVHAKNPGVWGNALRVEIDHNVTDAGADDLRFNLRVIRFASTAGNAQGLLAETFLDLSMDHEDRKSRFVKKIVNDESQLVQVKADDDLGGTVRPAANGTVSQKLDPNLTPFDTLGGGMNLVLAVNTATATLTWAPGEVTDLTRLREMVEDAVKGAISDSNDGSLPFEEASVEINANILRLRTGRSGVADEFVEMGGTATALEFNFSTVSGNLGPLVVTDFNTLGEGRTLILAVKSSTTTASLLWNEGEVTTLSQLRGRVESAIRASAISTPAFAGARVMIENKRFRILTGRSGATYAPADRITVSGPAAAGLGFSSATVSAQQFDLKGGLDGLAATATEIIGLDSLEPPTGMFALDNVDLFNILCLPAAAELEPESRDGVYRRAIEYCTKRRAICIVDIPQGTNTLSDMTDLMADMEAAVLRSPNAAIFYPRVCIPDPTDDYRLRDVGASGTLAGLFARIDTTRGVWKAPAGIETGLKGVSELEVHVNDDQNGVLNPLGINALRTFPVYGTIAWGSRTMVGADAIASEWAYIPVRRLALMLEESLFRASQWVVFEPNDEPTWANIRMNIGAFMNGLFQKGAFQGASPRDAYYVKCDSETTTQNDIDQGIVNIEVGFAPLKPAEFVVIRFRQIVGQIEV